MIMSPDIRKFVLTIHITSSVGWIGAVMAFLALVIAGMTILNGQLLHGIWIAIGVIGQFIVIPLAAASLLTGIVIALGTKWGLFQHYWVLFSLVLTLLSTIILLGNMQTVNVYLSAAAKMDSSDLSKLREALQSELLHGGIGLLVLLVVQVLNIYKPRGLTVYGWRKQQEQRAERQSVDALNPVESASNT